MKFKQQDLKFQANIKIHIKIELFLLYLFKLKTNKLKIKICLKMFIQIFKKYKNIILL